MWSNLADKTGRVVDSTLLLSLAAAFFYWASFPPLSIRVCAWSVSFFWAVVVRQFLIAAHHYGQPVEPNAARCEAAKQGVAFPAASGTRGILCKVWCAGYLGWLSLLSWMCYPVWWTVVVWMTTAALLAFFWMAFIWLSATVTVRCRLPQPLATAIAWTGVEWCRRTLLFGGFPFAAIEHSQYPNTRVIQIADIAGEYGLGFIMIVVGACAAEAVMFRATSSRTWGNRRRFAYGSTALCMVVALLGYGTFRVSNAHSQSTRNGPSRTIALLQGSTNMAGILQPPDFKSAFEECSAVSMRYGPQADVVVWPEAVCKLTWAHIATDYTPAEWRDASSAVVKSKVEQARIRLSKPLVDLAVASGAPLLLNLPVRDFGRNRSRNKLPPTNSILYIDPITGVGARYDKIKLAPFLEFDPTASVFGRDTLVRTEFRSGNQAVAFPIPRKKRASGDEESHNQLRSAGSEEQFFAATNICFDSMFPHIVRRQLHELRTRGIDPDVIINVSNDADTSRTNALDMHFATHVFRAVENRKPYLVASNCGSSAWIDCYGRVVRKGVAGSEGCVIADVSRTHEWSVYRQIGDVLPISCALISCIAVCITILGGRVAAAKKSRRRTPCSSPAGP